MCELVWNTASLTVTLISGADFSIRDTGGHFEYSPGHKLAKTLSTVIS